jgi:hypothetical protein
VVRDNPWDSVSLVVSFSPDDKLLVVRRMVLKNAGVEVEDLLTGSSGAVLPSCAAKVTLTWPLCITGVCVDVCECVCMCACVCVCVCVCGCACV